MCLAIPVEVKALREFDADVEISGVTRTISVQLTPEVKVGDFVLVHAGYAISVLEPEEAQETLRLFEELLAADGEEP